MTTRAAKVRDPLEPYASSAAALTQLRPRAPVYGVYGHRIAAAVQRFRAGLPGQTIYAVKVNPAPAMLRHLAAAGLRRFDTASLAEIALVKSLVPDAVCYYMAPVRPMGDLAEAYRHFAIRHFALDSRDELDTLRDVADAPGEVTAYVRLATPLGGSMFELSSKFGVGPAEAAGLIDRAAGLGFRTALTFHVGSQCLDPGAYARAISLARETAALCRAPVTALDVGGGFPAHYPGGTAPPLEAFFSAIRDRFAEERFPPGTALYAEPGRALAADGLSLLCQVMHRRDERLYINDGVYGSLMEAKLPGSSIQYPTRAFRAARDGTVRGLDGRTRPFTLYGPTCDAYDVLPRPFALPEGIAAGDWIEFGLIGAYSVAMRTAFNGFYPDTFVEIAPGGEPPGAEAP